MRIFLTLLIALLLPIMSLAKDNIPYKNLVYKNSTYHIIIVDPTQKISVGSTLKGHESGVNCSYFNMNTRKIVKPGDYNRPFLVFKNNTVLLTDDKKELIGQDKVASAGSWIIKDSKPYSTADHFSRDFKRIIVPRTCIGTKGDLIYLIATKKASFWSLQQVGLKLGLENMINLDGGTSTRMKYKGKTLLIGKRSVVNYIIIN